MSRHKILTTILVLAFAALSIPRLNVILTYDDAVTLNYLARSHLHALIGYIAPNNHLLNSLFVWMFTSIMGRSELAIRVPAFFAALIALTLVYQLALRAKSYQAGVTAMLLLGTNV